MTKPAPCTAAIHCGWCRNRKQGGSFRRSLAQLLHVGMDGDWFDCPYGLREGQRGDYSRPLTVIRDVESVRSFAEDVCTGCQHEDIGPASTDFPDGVPGCRLFKVCGDKNRTKAASYSKFVKHLMAQGACPLPSRNEETEPRRDTKHAEIAAQQCREAPPTPPGG